MKTKNGFITNGSFIKYKSGFTTSSPFFANAMLCVRLIFPVDFQ